MSTVSNYTNLVVETLETTIANGQTKSEIIDMKGSSLKTILLPAAFDGANLTFEVSDDRINFYPYYNISNVAVSIDITAGRAYGVAAIDFYSIQYMKIVSSVSQGADRTIKLITRAI
jgi:hypothetical protein